MHYTQVYNSQPVPPELARWIAEMPKVEIHVHLEGATGPGLLFEMARRNQVHLPAATLEEWQAFYEFRDFDHFIDIYRTCVDCMRTPQDFADMAEDFLRRQAGQHILYSEVYFSAALHADKMPIDELIGALAEGARTGEQRYGSRLALIPDLSRDYVLNTPLEDYVLDFAVRAKQAGIGVGLGIGGREIGYGPELFVEPFAEARRQGLHVVAHAGETDVAQSVREAVELLKAERIGHGLHAVEDAGVLAYLREKQVPVEVSPQSNYCTRVVPLDRPHPIRQMVEAGVYCTINSDDPPMFSTDLNNEYLTLAAQGFTPQELWQLNLNGLNATFLDPAQKDELRRAWTAFESADRFFSGGKTNV